jgi:hypothetical protein
MLRATSVYTAALVSHRATARVLARDVTFALHTATLGKQFLARMAPDRGWAFDSPLGTKLSEGGENRMPQITDKMVAEAITKAVAEAGSDYVYPPSAVGGDCLYVDDTPMGGCIVGATARLLGFNDFAEFDSPGAQDWAEELSPFAVDALTAAQAVQDGGQPWGDALSNFYDFIPI